MKIYEIERLNVDNWQQEIIHVFVPSPSEMQTTMTVLHPDFKGWRMTLNNDGSSFSVALFAPDSFETGLIVDGLSRKDAISYSAKIRQTGKL